MANIEEQRKRLLALPGISEDKEKNIIQFKFCLAAQIDRHQFMMHRAPTTEFLVQTDRLMNMIIQALAERKEVLREIHNETYRYEILPNGQFANVSKIVF